MSSLRRLWVLGVSLIFARRAFACEPVVPFMQVTMPALALSGSVLALALAVLVKSVLFAFFERRIPRLKAAWRMFLGNILTSLVGLVVAVMIASGAAVWIVGVPVAWFLCWLPSRRLVKVARMDWLRRMSSPAIAALMTGTFLASCTFFVLGRGAMETYHLATYWVIKIAAIVLALLASVTLTSIWEEWAIWRLSGQPHGTDFFTSVVRANLYVLILILAIPAALILPKRLKSPDFLARHPAPTFAQKVASSR